MLKIKRLITGNGFSYNNVEFMDFKVDQQSIGIDDYITDKSMNQIVVKTDDGKIRILTDWTIGILEIGNKKPSSDFEKFTRITVSGEISYSPAYLIKNNDYKSHDVPRIFEHQLSFVADNILYVCRQGSLIEITK